MTDVIEYNSMFGVDAVVRFLQAEGMSQSEIHLRLANTYERKFFSRKEMLVWCNIFKDG
jgi:hypothetical protein